MRPLFSFELIGSTWYVYGELVGEFSPGTLPKIHNIEDVPTAVYTMICIVGCENGYIFNWIG